MSLVTCLHPQTVYNKYLGKYITVPCGSCYACRSLKSNKWALRLELETQYHRYCLFSTLTYGGRDYMPFTYADDLDLLGSSPTMEKSLLDSSLYIEANDGKIYHHSVADIQCFIKRLRQRIARDKNINLNERQLRYFCAFEYGPSGFMPHYHILFWFDSESLALSIKNHIFEAWKPNTCWKSYEDFERINKQSFVRTSCSQYVAGYLNTDSQLPAILREPLFRQRHLQSQSPAIGNVSIQQSQIRELLFGDACQVGVVKPSTSRFVNVSLWCSLEGRYFPRCPQFALLTPAQRIAMYKFSSTFGHVESYRAFEERFLREWKENVSRTEEVIFGEWCFADYSFPLWNLYRKVFEYYVSEDGFPMPNKNAVRRWFYKSRRISKLCSEYSVGIPYYVSRIEAYYRRKEYNCLKSQLQFEEDFSRSQIVRREGLHCLPFIIDSQFYENKRNLSALSYDLYLEQFGVSDKVLSIPENSLLWKQAFSLYRKIVMDNTKTRVHKEFVALHPEYSLIYLQNRLNYAISS